MHYRTRAAVLVADHSKFKRTAPARIASAREVDTFFTDLPLPAGLAEKCDSWGTEVHFAPEE